MSYRPFSRMTETARRTELWRLVLGIVMVGLVSFGLQQALIGLAALALSDAAYWALISQLRVADAPLGMLLLLVSLGGLGVGTVVTARVLHKRSGASLFGPLPLALSQALRCTVAVAGSISSSRFCRRGRWPGNWFRRSASGAGSCCYRSRFSRW